VTATCHFVVFLNFFILIFNFFIKIFLIFLNVHVSTYECATCHFVVFLNFLFYFFEFFLNFFELFFKCPRVNLVMCHVSKLIFYIQSGPYLLFLFN